MISGPETIAANGRLNTSNYLATLDGWRAIAILGVLCAHGAHRVLGPGGLYPSPTWYDASGYGVLGVDIFFGISGFLICTRLLQEEQRLGRINLKSFYIRRVFRILPPYLLYLLAAVLLTATGVIAAQRWEFVSCLLFFRNYMPLDAAQNWYTGHFWSLAVEEHYYLLWPPLLFLLGVRRARPTVLGLAILVALWRVVEFRYGFVSHRLLDASFYVRTDIRADALLWGCWMALLFHVPKWRGRLQRWLLRGVWTGLVAGFAACVVMKPHFVMTWQAILIPFLLIGTVLHPNWAVSRLLESAPLRWIGRISYSLYLWQQIFVTPLGQFGKLGVVQRFPVNILATVVAACLSYYCMEKYLIRLGHKLAARESAKLALAGRVSTATVAGPVSLVSVGENR
jgi:peptidoglycan/LPS O-acetylase OafA/YrhL